ncbi:MAG: hypothetical protein ACFE8E_12585 [Candidatus Hodarchaeota archaeon]
MVFTIFGASSRDCDFNWFTLRYNCEILTERELMIRMVTLTVTFGVALLVGLIMIISFMGGILRQRQSLFSAEKNIDRKVAWISIAIASILILFMSIYLSICLPSLLAP